MIKENAMTEKKTAKRKTPLSKFKIGDTLLFILKSQDKFWCILKSVPKNNHLYWYVKQLDNDSLIGIRDDSIEAIIKPSEQFLQDMASKTINTLMANYQKDTTDMIQ